MRLAPENEDFRIDYGSALINAGRMDDAVSRFRSVSPISLNRCGCGWGWGLPCTLPDVMKPAVLQCVRLAPGFTPAYDLLGKIYESSPEKQDRIAAAFAEYLGKRLQRCTGSIPLRCDSLRPGGWRNARPVPACERAPATALEARPKPRTGSSAARLHRASRGKKKKTPWVLLKRAVKLEPSYAIARYRLGSAYQIGRASQSRFRTRSVSQIEIKRKRAGKSNHLTGSDRR